MKNQACEGRGKGPRLNFAGFDACMTFSTNLRPFFIASRTRRVFAIFSSCVPVMSQGPQMPVQGFHPEAGNIGQVSASAQTVITYENSSSFLYFSKTLFVLFRDYVLSCLFHYFYGKGIKRARLHPRAFSLKRSPAMLLRKPSAIWLLALLCEQNEQDFILSMSMLLVLYLSYQNGALSPCLQP